MINTKPATYGMALPYFLEVVELQDGIALSGSPVTHGEIGLVFGDQTVIVFGRTTDGQLWRLIYPDETTTCWVTPCRAQSSGQFATYPKAGECSNATQIREYTGEKIDVTYDAQRCIHAAECIRRLSAGFDTSKRPWVQPDQAEADQVAATILTCPSGALRYQRKDGGGAEPIPEQNTIRLVKNGPFYVRGDFTVVNGAGELVLKETRAALCRCGASANKPFCDNTHKRIGFIAE